METDQVEFKVTYPLLELLGEVDPLERSRSFFSFLFKVAVGSTPLPSPPPTPTPATPPTAPGGYSSKNSLERQGRR